MRYGVVYHNDDFPGTGRFSGSVNAPSKSASVFVGDPNPRLHMMRICIILTCHMTVTRAITKHFATSRDEIARLQHAKHVSELYSRRAEIENSFDLCGESQHSAPGRQCMHRMGHEKIDWRGKVISAREKTDY